MTEQNAAPTGMPQEAPPSPAQSGGNGMAVAALILAILAAITFWLPFVGLAVAILALVLSILGMKKARQVGGAGKGLSIAGLVVSIFALLGAAGTTACGVCVGAAANKFQEECEKQAKENGYESCEEFLEAGGQITTEGAEDFQKAMEEFQKAAEEAAREAQKAAEEAQGAEGMGE